MVLGFSLTLVSPILSQTESEIDILSAIYSDSDLETILSTDNEKAALMLFANSNGYSLLETLGKDPSSFEDILEVAPKNDNIPSLTPDAVLNSELNLIHFDIKFPQDGYKYYRIGDNQEYMVVVYSYQKIQQMFESNTIEE